MGRTLGILEGPLGAAELSDTSDQRKQTPKWNSVGGAWDLAHLRGTVNSCLTLNSDTTGLVVYSSSLRSSLSELSERDLLRFPLRGKKL